MFRPAGSENAGEIGKFRLSRCGQAKILSAKLKVVFKVPSFVARACAAYAPNERHGKVLVRSVLNHLV
jgi:hypothetical protein